MRFDCRPEPLFELKIKAAQEHPQCLMMTPTHVVQVGIIGAIDDLVGNVRCIVRR